MKRYKFFGFKKDFLTQKVMHIKKRSFKDWLKFIWKYLILVIILIILVVILLRECSHSTSTIRSYKRESTTRESTIRESRTRESTTRESTTRESTTRESTTR